MALTDKALIAELQAGHYKPVYLLTGEQNYFIDVVSDYMEQHIVEESARDFDQAVVYGKETTMGNVIALSKMFPIMSPRRLVLVKEAQDINAKEWDLLEKYLAAPSPQTVLAFCYRHKSLDKRTKAYKAIAKAGVVFEGERIYDSKVPGWITSRAREDGRTIDSDSAQLMANQIGTDLGKIVAELKKLYIAVPQGGQITREMVMEQIGMSKEFNVFELQNAIGRRDIMLCNRIVNYFIANPKANPIQMIIPSLYGYLLKVMYYHQLEDKSQAASVLGCNPYFVKDYEVAARNYSLGKLATCIGYLYEADLRSKGVRNAGTTTDGELLKELVFKIIH